MIAIYIKELSHFFSSLIAYIVIGVFLIFMGLVMWFWPETAVPYSNFADMNVLFYMAPTIFTFIIPAITMHSFSEERQAGTIELLMTKPIKNWQIVMGKFLANFSLIVFALIPTVIYYYSIYQLGLPKGNIDTGAVIGSYIGLFLLASVFVAIGTFSSVLTSNQVVAFIVGTFLCFLMHWGFEYTGTLPVFEGSIDDIIQKLGINYHYLSISRGIVDSRDVIYFLSVDFIFLLLTYFFLLKNKK